MNNAETSSTEPAVAHPAPISPEIGEACARLLMADSRIHEIIDEYPHGRYILSALNGRFGYKSPCSETAQRDLLAALGHHQFAGDFMKQSREQPVTIRPDVRSRP